jgi:hypothetical protein
MNLEQIQAKRKALQERLNKNRDQKDRILAEMKFLQSQCKHPNLYGYNTWGRWEGVACPDCGYDR